MGVCMGVGGLLRCSERKAHTLVIIQPAGEVAAESIEKRLVRNQIREIPKSTQGTTAGWGAKFANLCPAGPVVITGQTGLSGHCGENHHGSSPVSEFIHPGSRGM